VLCDGWSPMLTYFDTVIMPLTVRTQQWSTFPTASQSESEQAPLTWSQGVWHQQGEPNWMQLDGCSATEDMMDPERNEPLAFHPSGLSMPSISAAWNARRAQQFQQGSLGTGLVGDSTFPQPNGSMADWAASEYWPSSVFDEPSPSTPGNSPIFSHAEESATLPLFLKGSDCQNDVAFSANTSFSPTFDKASPTYQFGSTAETISTRSSVKRSPSSDQTGIAAEVTEAPKAKPKRGRPRLPRNEPHSCDTTESPCTHIIDESCGGRRVPHNQVEQKYRNGLNAELERLREAVSTAPHRNFNHLSGPAKPSKAMVLASAIDYIKSIEAERDQLQDENQTLRGRNKRLRREKKTTAKDDQ